MLQVLDLSHNKLDQESLLKVLEFCKGCGSLQELCLISASEDDSKLGEVVYMELCELLIHCSSLQVLGFNVGKVVEAQKGLAKNIETALIHNMSLVKWNQTEPTTTEYKKYLAANLWISANVGEGLEGIETLPEEVREIVDKKLALAKQYSNSARKPPQKMEIIREATYEEDEESKSASKIQYEYGSVITIQNEEIPQPFQDTNFMENLIKNVEVNCKKNYEELEKKLENISEFAKLKMNQTEKLAAEAIEATKEIQELKLENVELKRHIQAILDKVNALEKERNEDLKQIVLKEELVALREEVKAEVSEVTTLKIAAIEENIPECLANCSNEITAALKERVEKMEVALVDIQESTSNSSALQRAEAAHKRTEELSKQFKKVKEDLDKKLSDENNIWSGKFSQYEKKIEAVQRSQEILRKQAGQFQAKTQASLKELTEAKTTSNSQGNPAEMLKTLPEFTALKQKTSQALSKIAALETTIKANAKDIKREIEMISLQIKNFELVTSLHKLEAVPKQEPAEVEPEPSPEMQKEERRCETEVDNTRITLNLKSRPGSSLSINPKRVIWSTRGLQKEKKALPLENINFQDSPRDNSLKTVDENRRNFVTQLDPWNSFKTCKVEKANFRTSLQSGSQPSKELQESLVSKGLFISSFGPYQFINP